jgi:flagella basal body P-ring formation protein FlgA
MRIFQRFLILLLLPTLQAQSVGSNELLGIQALVFAENAAKEYPGQYSIKLARPATLPPLKPGKVTFEADRMSKQEPIGRFFVVFRVAVDGLQSATTRVELEGSWSGNIYQAKVSLPRKTILTQELLEVVSFEGIPPAGTLKEIPEGMRLRQPLAIGKTITQSHVEPIPLINATDRVRVTLKNGPLQITSDAIARSNGAKGDQVRLEVDGSKKLVYAVVTGPCEATIDMKNVRRGIGN